MALFPPAPGGGEEVEYGYKGKGVLLHFLIDKNGHAIAISTTSAGGNGRGQIQGLLGKVPSRSLKGRMMILEVDKGYDAAWLVSGVVKHENFSLDSLSEDQRKVHTRL